jgi:hypothetical protein
MSINVELTKQLLVACDQAYFTSAGQVQGSRLAPLPDKDSNAPEEYGDPFVYRDEPLFWYDNNYAVVAPIDKSDEIGGNPIFTQDPKPGREDIFYDSTGRDDKIDAGGRRRPVRRATQDLRRRAGGSRRRGRGQRNAPGNPVATERANVTEKSALAGRR